MPGPGSLYGSAVDFSGVRLHGYHRWPYEQIADIIEAAIESGELQPHDRIPTEKDLMDQAGVSRWAARHAVGLLRDKGLVFTRHALGSFVAPPPG